MNTLNSKTIESNKFIYQFTDKLNLKNPNKNMALANLSIYYTWKNIKSEYNNNKFKIHAPTWNDEFDLPDGSYSVGNLLFFFFTSQVIESPHSLNILIMFLRFDLLQVRRCFLEFLVHHLCRVQNVSYTLTCKACFEYKFLPVRIFLRHHNIFKKHLRT